MELRINTLRISLSLLFCTIICIAQAQNDPSLFKTIPPIEENTPVWARLMYSANPNVWKVDEEFAIFYQKNSFIKNTHTQNYKYWKRLLSQNHWIDQSGYISIPSFEELEKSKRTWHQKWAETQTDRNINGNWSAIGPFETWDGSQWISKQVNVYTIDQSLSHPDILYCGTETGGIFKTVDKGLTWTSVGDALNIGGVGTIKVHPERPDTVYVGQGNNLHQTLDGGQSWQTVFSASGLNPRDVLFLPTAGPDPMIVFVATKNGVLRSINGGTSWTYVTNDQSWDVERKPFSLDTVYLLQTNVPAQHIRFFRSIDKGLTFTEFNSGWFAGSSAGLDNSTKGARMAVTPANPDYIYVALLGNDVSYAQDNNWIGVYKSADAGSSWTLPAGDPGGPYSAAHICLSSFHPTFDWGGNYDQGYYNLGIAVSESDPEQIMVGCLNLWKSDDGGVSYTGIGGYQPGISGYSHPDIQEIEINGNDVWVATDGGVDLYVSDLSSKVSLNNGINGSEYWGFDSGWNEDVLVGGRYHNGNVVLYQNYPSGKSRNLGGAESATGYVNQGFNRKVYHSDIGGKKIPTDFNGAVLNIGNLGKYPNQAVSNENKGEIEPDPRYYDHLYLTADHQLWKSIDGGTTFDLIHTFGSDAGHQTKGLEISRSNPQVIYVCQRVSGAAKLWRTNDGGSNWSEITLPTASTGGGIFISLSPTDEDHLFLAVSNGGSNTQKIYVTINGGSSWTNLTTSTLDGHWPEQIMVQGGTSGGVYLATQLGVFYRNLTHTDWQLFNQGLPVRFSSMTMKPFYKNSEVRVATYNRGIWSSPFYESSLPIAQPTVDKMTSNCSRDTFYFEDYSMLDHQNATWSWAISPAPAYVSSLTERNPKVVLGNDGSYDVTLTVTDGNGNSSSKMIASMVNMESRCEADTIPGKGLRSIVEADYFIATDANLTNLTHFTVTGWWKPSGGQAGFAALFSSGDWCAHCDYTEGLIVDYFGSRVWYKWPGNAANWGSNSGMVIPVDEWSYVAMVIEPTGATLYLNEQKYVHNIPLDTGVIETIHIGRGHYSNTFIGDIDEVTIWKRALTESEIRELRHLTKDDVVASDPDLIAYYQFNQLENGQILDHAGSLHGTMVGDASLQPSTAPIGGGESVLMNVAAGGSYSFPGTGVDIQFPGTGTYPNGDIVVSKLNVVPDGGSETDGVPPNRYWIINNYGSNQSFSALESMTFSDLPIGDPSMPGAYELFKRNSNADGFTWGTAIDFGDIATGSSLTFNSGLSVTEFSQFAIQSKTLACLIVQNIQDDGEGSLRNAIDCAEPGQIIHFSSLLDGDSIQLTSMPIQIGKDLIIQGRGRMATILNASQLERAMSISPVQTVSIKGLSVLGGNGSTGRAIENAGELLLEDIDLIHSVFPNTGQSLIENLPGSLIEMSESVQVKKN